MTAPGRSPSNPPPTEPDDPRARTVGVALIVVAVIIGVVLLGKGFSQEDSLVSTESAGAERSTTTTVATGGAVEDTTTTAAPAVGKPPAEVTVLVANGSGVTGVAGTNATTLQGKGYTKVETTNAPTTAKSTVYYTAGAQADAQAVATALGLDQATVTAMPSTPPIELAEATVLVIIGSDRS